MRDDESKAAGRDGSGLALFIALAAVSLIIPPVGLIVGTIFLFLRRDKSQEQGVWLLGLGMLGAVVHVALRP